MTNAACVPTTPPSTSPSSSTSPSTCSEPAKARIRCACAAKSPRGMKTPSPPTSPHETFSRFPCLPQHRDGAGFDAAVALVEIDIDFDLAFFSGFEGRLDIGLQGRLIAFDGEQIIGSGVADGLGDVRIASDRVDRD